MQNNIKFKIAVPIVIIIALLLVVMVISAISISARNLKAINENKGIAISHIACESLLAAITFMDTDSIKNNLKNLSTDPDIIAIKVLDNKLKEIAAEGEKFELPAGLEIKSEQIITETGINQKAALLFVSPIKEKNSQNASAYLILALSQNRLQSAVKNISNLLISMALLIYGNLLPLPAF